MSERHLAVFCDFENVALGVRDLSAKDASRGVFDMALVLERLLLKGDIVVKKAYCDWDRYKEHKAAMHGAAFELIEIPHLRQSGKNSADIRMVVDALDLCYTKEHLDSFVIISGDSDFSPLVGKLRENAKTVIGVGVRNSTSDLLVNACDEFIFYDDLIAKPTRQRRSARARGKEPPRDAARESEKVGAKDKAAAAPKAPVDVAAEGIDLVLETAEALYAEKGDRQKIWGSMIKQTLTRRRPGFSESAYGFSSFGDLLEEAESRGLLTLERHEKSGGYVVREIVREA
ncbi:MAG: NYN domain-containing protein [Pseudomonadota bacterium]